RPLPILLSSFTEVRREAVRPRDFREPDFDEKYDSDTLFYDAFWAPSSDRILLVGPSLLNLLPALRAMSVIALPSKIQCPFTIRTMDRHAQIWVDAPPGTDALQLQGDLGTIEVRVAPNASELFRERRVLFTLSKNNALEWILDWIRFHRDIHGA